MVINFYSTLVKEFTGGGAEAKGASVALGQHVEKPLVIEVNEEFRKIHNQKDRPRSKTPFHPPKQQSHQESRSKKQSQKPILRLCPNNVQIQDGVTPTIFERFSHLKTGIRFLIHKCQVLFINKTPEEFICLDVEHEELINPNLHAPVVVLSSTLGCNV